MVAPAGRLSSSSSPPSRPLLTPLAAAPLSPPLEAGEEAPSLSQKSAYVEPPPVVDLEAARAACICRVGETLRSASRPLPTAADVEEEALPPLTRSVPAEGGGVGRPLRPMTAVVCAWWCFEAEGREREIDTLDPKTSSSMSAA